MANEHPPTFHLDADIRSVAKRLAPESFKHPFNPSMVDRVRAYLLRKMMSRSSGFYLDYYYAYHFFSDLQKVK